MNSGSVVEKPRMSPLARAALVVITVELICIVAAIFSTYYGDFGLSRYYRFLWGEYFWPDISIVAVFSLILSLILGDLALAQINSNPRRYSGIWIARTALILPLILFIMPNYLKEEHRGSPAVACKNNLKQLGIGVDMYALDHRAKLPSPDRWNDSIQVYIKNKGIWICPEVWDEIPTYAMNDQLRELKLNDIKDPEHTVILFESIEGKNLHGGPELFPKKPRHTEYETKEGLYIIGFADFHVIAIPKSKLNTLNWDPKKKAAEDTAGP